MKSARMSIYLVVPFDSDLAKYKAALSLVGDVFPLDQGKGFLVKYPGTTKELCENAGLVATDGPRPRTGAALVTLVANYWGFGNTDMWEWLASRWEK